MAENARTGVAGDVDNIDSVDAKKGRASKKNKEKERTSGVVGASGNVEEADVGVDENNTREGVDEEGRAVDDGGEVDDVADSEAGDTADEVDGEGRGTDVKPEKRVRRPRKAKASAQAKAATREAVSVKADDVMNEADSSEEFQEAVREQIENCKNELQISLGKSIRQEFSAIVEKRLKATNRRRRAGIIVRDTIILLLSVVVGYFGWCLYDVRYFDWMGPQKEVAQEAPSKDEVDEPEMAVKDTRWYVNNYGYLFEDLQVGLEADGIEAYYLYSDDRKVSEIKPAYLLGMAYNKVVPAAASSMGAAAGSAGVEISSAGASVAAADLRAAFEKMFGTTEYFEKVGFTHGCKKFSYAREEDAFVTENGDCVPSSKREIVEEIDEAYEEGSVLYILTTAAIYDKEEASFYNFDNLFKPAVVNAAEGDLEKNRALLNQYQYQFKKTGEEYHFSGVVKLR